MGQPGKKHDSSASNYRRPFTVKSFTNATVDKDDVAVAREWLSRRSRWYDGETVSEYQEAFARWNCSNHAFAFMHGRVALSACIYALGLKEGDEVIIPGYTCVVVPNAFHYFGITVVYSDIELDTYGLDASLLEEKITPNTRAILLHHLYGLVCRDYEKILDLAKKHNLKTIEDCAHSTGAEYMGLKVGNRGDAGFYSSQRSKVFSTIQGGMAVTNDPGTAKRMEDYYQQARVPGVDGIDKQLHNVLFDYYRYKHPCRWWLGFATQRLYGDKKLPSVTPGEMAGQKPHDYDQKMVAPIAALGLNQLRKIDRYNEQRRQTAGKWEKWCDENGYGKPLVVKDSVPVFLRYPVLVEPEKKEDLGWLKETLKTNVGVWFVSNIHPSDRMVEGCPNADKAVAQCINLPGLLV